MGAHDKIPRFLQRAVALQRDERCFFFFCCLAAFFFAASAHLNISFREARSCFKQRCMLSLIAPPLIVTFLEVPMAWSRPPPGRPPPRLLTWQHALREIATVFLTCCWLIKPIFAAPALLFSNNDMTWLRSCSNRSICSNKNKNNYVLQNPPQTLSSRFTKPTTSTTQHPKPPQCECTCLLKYRWSCLRCSEPSSLCKQDDPVKLLQFNSTKVPLLGQVCSTWIIQLGRQRTWTRRKEIIHIDY